MLDISQVTDRLWTGGGLRSHLGKRAKFADLDELRRAGIVVVIDNRLEWSDEEFVRRHAPEVRYVTNPQDDAGQAMPDWWFERGVSAALAVLTGPDGSVLAHCHAGVNRGPSMAFAIMLATGEDPVQALDAIRRARPIASIGYSLDALDWWHRVGGAPRHVAAEERTAVIDWQRRHAVPMLRLLRPSIEETWIED